MIGRVSNYSFLLIPRAHGQRCVSDKLYQLICLLKNTLPKRMDGTAYVVDVNSRNVLLEKQLECNGSATSVWLSVFAIQQVVPLHQLFNKSRELSFPTWIAQ